MTPCPACGANVHWTHRYQCGARSATARGSCTGCGKIFTELRLIVDENPTHGRAAKSPSKSLDGDALADQVRKELPWT